MGKTWENPYMIPMDTNGKIIIMITIGIPINDTWYDTNGYQWYILVNWKIIGKLEFHGDVKGSITIYWDINGKSMVIGNLILWS
jgi:hypothetical protein